MSSKIAILNNASRVIIGQLPHSFLPPRPSLGEEHPRFAETGGIVSLVPGANLVDADAWTELMKNALWQQWLKMRIPKIAADEGRTERVGRPVLEIMSIGKNGVIDSDLRKLSPREASVIVPEILDERLLTHWLSVDGRSEVRDLLEAQYRAIRPERRAQP